MSARFSRKKVGCSGWMGGWMDVKAGLRIAYSNQKSQFILTFSIDLNFSIKSRHILIFSKNSQKCIEIKFEIENVDFVRQKL